MTACAQCNPFIPCAACECITAGHLRAALRREHYSVAAFTLLDGGSGNEMVVGFDHDGEFSLHSLQFWHCHGPAMAAECRSVKHFKSLHHHCRSMP